MAVLPPWHLWGQAIAFSASTGFQGASNESQQLVRIDYGRPTTWHWLFWARLLQSGFNPVVNDIQLSFDVIVGLGRASIVIPDFEIFQWSSLTDVGEARYSTSSTGPLRFVGDPVGANQISELAAQSINVNARASFAFNPQECTIEVGAQFSPVEHIRPEWFEQRFPGGETEGH